jgi:hypothetical protein
MLSLSDAREFVSKKLTRNDNLIELFKLYDQILDEEIKIKCDLKKFYAGEIEELVKINRVEKLQLNEYDIIRQNIVNTEMKNLGIYIKTDNVRQCQKKIKSIKSEIIYRASVINNIQELIPDTGVVTNYKIFMPVD